ncbi:hypothetical protein ACHAWU_003910 [Discostella pseudostelligera]|uniref:Derlin n=1 Tax=Discostella pseudostelligera TaxID=259834 RepID=A0ABD3MK37_9STRA
MRYQTNHLAILIVSAIALACFPVYADGRGRGHFAPSCVYRAHRINDGSSERRSHDGQTSQFRTSYLSPIMQSRITLIRGGAFDDDSDDESDMSDFDFDNDENMFDFDAAEDDFGDENTLTQIIEAYHKTPPLTKAYLTASFGAALLGYITNKNDFPSILQLEWKPILTQLQIWRPLTAFLNFGPLGLGYLMTAQFVWTYMSTLERLNHSKPYDFWFMMFFGSASMVLGYSVMGLSPRFLGHNLSTFMVYVWSRYHEGMEVNMFELFNTRAEMLPWFFLAQTFLLEGEVPILDFLGIVFGHIYHHYKTTNVLRTPNFVIQWYNGDSQYARMLREKYKTISSDFEM